MSFTGPSMRKSQQIALEIQNTVTRIRAGATLPTRELLALSDEYNRQIDSVNRRLQEVGILLHSGHRSQALQDAESLPPVLEEAATLDFNAAREWAEVCQQHELPQPSQVDLNRASELNNAYFVELRLTPLLVRNRRLALSRAPTEVRIQVLKHLAEEDRSNPIWPQDLIAFEKVRLREIERDLPGIIRAGNITQIEKLRQELSGKWLEPVPDAIRKQVEDIHHALKTKAARNALPELEALILAAHQQQDSESLRAALSQWQDRASAAGIARQPEPVAAAAAWLEQTDQSIARDRLFTNALMELEATLDVTTSSSQLKTELERAWTKVQKFDRALPQVLVTRYETRRAELQLDSRRRFVVLAVGTGCLILVIALGVAFAIHLTLQSSQTSQWVSTLEKAVAQDRLPDAEQIIRQIQQDNPKATSIPVVADAIARAHAAISEDKSRAERFELAMASCEKSGVEALDQSVYETAQRLAKRDFELVRLERFGALVKSSRQKELQARDNEFKSSLETVRERFVQTKDNATLSPADRAIQMQGIADDLRKLTARNDVSPGIKGAGDILLSNVLTILKGTQDSVEHTRKRTESLDRLRILMATPSEYARALTQFAQDNPDSPLTPDFTRAAAYKPLWTSAKFWADTLPALGPVSDTANTEEVRKKIQDGLAADGSEPFKHQLTGIEDYLAKQNKFVLDRPWEDRLKRALDASFVSNLMMVQTKSVSGIPGARYYLLPGTQPVLGNDARGKEVYTFPYILNPAQAAGSEPPGGNAQVPVDIYQPPVKSPQSLFADQARPLLSERNALANWESYHLQWLQYAGRPGANVKIEPILHTNLAQLILPGVFTYDLVADRQALEDLRKTLSNFKIDTAWIDPFNQPSDKLRTQILQEAPPDGWPDLKPLIATAQQAGKDLRAMAHRTTTRKPVAILFPDDAGSLGFASQLKDAPANLTLEAFFINDQNQPAARVLGVTKGPNQVELLPGALDHLPAGTLIYGSPAAAAPKP